MNVIDVFAMFQKCACVLIEVVHHVDQVNMLARLKQTGRYNL